MAFGNAVIASASNDQDHGGETKKTFESWANQETVAGLASGSATVLSGFFEFAGFLYGERKKRRVCPNTRSSEDRGKVAPAP
jgi:hypothetical protein